MAAVSSEFTSRSMGLSAPVCVSAYQFFVFVCLQVCVCACRAGEEVTISYGSWPNDVFLLFFGFVPDGNEHNAVVLFHDLSDLIACYNRVLQHQQNAQAQHTGQQSAQLQSTAHAQQQDSTDAQKTDEQQHSKLPNDSARSQSPTTANDCSHQRNASTPSLPASADASPSSLTHSESDVTQVSEAFSLDSETSQSQSAPQLQDKQQQHALSSPSDRQLEAQHAKQDTNCQGQSHTQHQWLHGEDTGQTIQASTEASACFRQASQEEQHALLLQDLGPEDWSRYSCHAICSTGNPATCLHVMFACRHHFRQGPDAHVTCRWRIRHLQLCKTCCQK